MIQCQEWWELISASLDGALSREENTRLQAHLAQCSHCRALLAALQMFRGITPDSAPGDFVEGVMSKVAETPQDVPFTDLPQNRKTSADKETLRRWWKPIKGWAAVALCALVLAGSFTMARQSGLFAAKDSNSAPADANGVVDQYSNTENANPESAPAATAPVDDGLADAVLRTIELDGLTYTHTGIAVDTLPEGAVYGGQINGVNYYTQPYHSSTLELYLEELGGYTLWRVE